MTQTYSAGGIILNNLGEVLLINEGDDFWGFPKGRIESGEDVLSAAKREIREETGLARLAYIRELGSYQRYPVINGKVDRSEMKNITLILFTADETLTAENEENNESRWVKREDVAKMLTDVKDREFYSQYLATDNPINNPSSYDFDQTDQG